MKKLIEQIQEVVIPTLTVKADLFDTKLEKYGIFPNASDSFIISDEMKERSLSHTKGGIQKTLSLGSKMIGAYRDKGSITAIVEDDYQLVVDFTLEDMIEVDNFCSFLKQINKKIIKVEGTTVSFIPDVIAGTSTSRDNVNALLINGLMELDCIIDDIEVEMSVEELTDVTIEDLADVRNRDHRLYIIDKNGSVVEELGTHLVIFENFFWQPHHDNVDYISKKTINCLYHQAVDGFQIYHPIIYKAIQKSIDFESVKEDMLCLGLELDFSEDESDFTEEELNEIYQF